MELLNRHISCPYCGEGVEFLIDDSATDQDYFEDCSVCCRPVRVLVSVDFAGECEVVILRDDE